MVGITFSFVFVFEAIEIQRNVLVQNGPFIGTKQIILSVLVCSRFAFTSFYREFKKLLKIRYAFLLESNETSFSDIDLLPGGQYCPMSEKNVTKMNGICVW